VYRDSSCNVSPHVTALNCVLTLMPFLNYAALLPSLFLLTLPSSPATPPIYISCVSVEQAGLFFSSVQWKRKGLRSVRSQLNGTYYVDCTSSCAFREMWRFWCCSIRRRSGLQRLADRWSASECDSRVCYRRCVLFSVVFPWRNP
jgi:hypothetical protein